MQELIEFIQENYSPEQSSLVLHGLTIRNELLVNQDVAEYMDTIANDNLMGSQKAMVILDMLKQELISLLERYFITITNNEITLTALIMCLETLTTFEDTLLEDHVVVMLESKITANEKWYLLVEYLTGYADVSSLDGVEVSDILITKLSYHAANHPDATDGMDDVYVDEANLVYKRLKLLSQQHPGLIAVQLVQNNVAPLQPLNNYLDMLSEYVVSLQHRTSEHVQQDIPQLAGLYVLAGLSKTDVPTLVNSFYVNPITRTEVTQALVTLLTSFGCYH